MAYATVTLTGTYQTPDGTPHKGHVEIIPSERVIKDTTGDVILTGRVKVDLDAQGAFSVVLPATDDETLNPTGFGYTIAAKLHSSHPPAVSFSLPASLGATTVEDLTPVDPATFEATATYAEKTELDAVAATIPTTAADVNALPDTTTPSDIGAEPAGLAQATTDTLAATNARKFGAAGVVSLQSDTASASLRPYFEQHNNGAAVLSVDTVAGETVSWCSVLRVDGILDAPIDTYYMWYSTDHDTVGGFYLATAPTPEGPWTKQGNKYVDTVAGNSTETPQIVWNEKEQLFFGYYHQVAPGGVGGQSTMLATSPDGENWTRVGIVIDIASQSDVAGDGHTGYFKPHRIGNLWFGYHLVQSGTFSFSGLSYSYDGRRFFTDPRRLGWHADLFPNPPSGMGPYRRIAWIGSNVFSIGGRLWWLGMMGRAGNYGGATPHDRIIGIAPLAPTLRNLEAVPTIIGPAPGETTNIIGTSVMVDGDTIYLYYVVDKAEIRLMKGTLRPGNPDAQTVLAPDTEGTYGQGFQPRDLAGNVIPVGRVRQEQTFSAADGALPAGWGTTGTPTWQGVDTGVPRLQVVSAATSGARAEVYSPEIDLSKFKAVEWTIEGACNNSAVPTTSTTFSIGFGLYTDMNAGVEYRHPNTSSYTQIRIYEPGSLRTNPSTWWEWRRWAGAPHSLTMRFEMGHAPRNDWLYILEGDQVIYARQMVTPAGAQAWTPGLVRGRFYFESNDGNAKTMYISKATLAYEHM